MPTLSLLEEVQQALLQLWPLQEMGRIQFLLNDMPIWELSGVTHFT